MTKRQFSGCFRKTSIQVEQGLDMWREWVSKSEVTKLAELWREKSRTRWQAEVEEQAKEPQVCGNEASLDFKQQHFQILARRYISSGQKIHIFWPEDIYLLARRYISHLSLPIPISSGQKIYIFWPEDTDYRFSYIGKCQIWMMWMVRFVTFVHMY